MRAMRAERFGSYSIPTTSAATPRLRRLKSTLRYFCLWPPPMCRDVSRPRLFRPPLLFFGSRRLLSGRHFVISSKAGSDLKRSVGVNGRNSLRAITIKNPKSEMRNPKQFWKSECSKRTGRFARSVLHFGFCSFELVLDFDIRHSDFSSLDE